MTKQPMAAALSQSPPLRLTTFVRIRWLAVAGQSAALLFVDSVLGFPYPLMGCAVLVILSAALNLYLTLRYPVAQRMSPRAVFGVLLFDIMQLGGLLYLTGGAQNPFILLLLVPVVISATVLPLLMTATLGVLAIAVTTLLAFFHLPLPWYPGTQLVLPFAYIGGQWVAIVSSLVFTAVYAWRVAAEARQLSDALTATELILQREQHLSAIDGLAAAAAHELGTPLATIALVAKEMSKALEGEERFADDLALLNSQAARCRDILRRISSLDAENRDYFDRLPLSSLIEEVVAPHRDFDVEIETRIDRRDQQEPVTRRSTGVIYGLGNIVENAVDFARSKVIVDCRCLDGEVIITVTDDGTGYPADIIDHLGEPYTPGDVRRERDSGGGLGLGLFIAKTLLARSGASVTFRNSATPGLGAQVTVRWLRQALEFTS